MELSDEREIVLLCSAHTALTIMRQWSGRPRSARTDDVDSVNELILSQKGAPESQNHTSNFMRYMNSSLFGVTCRSSAFDVQMFEEAPCARTHCYKLCVAPNSRTKTATLFPNIRCGRHVFNWWACVKVSGHLEHLIWWHFSVLTALRSFRIDLSD